MNAKVKPKIIWSEECVSISEEQACFIDMLISLISNTFFFHMEYFNTPIED